MENKNKQEICEIVQDLLPLYVDGACTDGSRKLVEEHMKECEKCKRQFHGMSGNLQVPELPKRDMKIKKAFHKIWVTTVALCGAILLMVVALIYMNDRAPEYKMTRENEVFVERVENILKIWDKRGYEEAIDEMEPTQIYQNLSAEVTPKDVNELFGDSFEENQPEYIKFKISEKEYRTRSEYLSWENPTTEAELQMKNALEKNNETKFWYEMIKDKSPYIIITEEIHSVIMEKYDDLEEKYFHRMEMDSGVYYYYEIPYNDDSVHFYAPDFSKDMYEKINEIEKIDYGYIVAASANYMPEELYQEYLEKYETVRGWLEAYAKLYQNMDYGIFVEDRRGKLKSIFAELEQEGIYLESYSIDYENCVFQASDDTECWRVTCQVKFSNGYEGLMYFRVEDEDVYPYAIYTKYTEQMTSKQKKEQEEFFNKIGNVFENI